jgi:hypothetical protein
MGVAALFVHHAGKGGQQRGTTPTHQQQRARKRSTVPLVSDYSTMAASAMVATNVA